MLKQQLQDRLLSTAALNHELPVDKELAFSLCMLRAWYIEGVQCMLVLKK